METGMALTRDCRVPAAGVSMLGDVLCQDGVAEQRNRAEQSLQNGGNESFNGAFRKVCLYAAFFRTDRSESGHRATVMSPQRARPT